MIELANDRLTVTSPHTHPAARTSIEFQRTLRIPDDGNDYPLPAGLGRFPLRHVEDLGDRVPDAWRTRKGIVLPMWRSEALWINFAATDYPWALKVAAGKRCAITGKPFTMDLHDDDQDYVVVPAQPWLDGFAVDKGRIRQFVAMPLGAGYTVEEQLTGTAEWGGLQIVAYPLTAARFEQINQARRARATELGFGNADAAVRSFDMPMAAAPSPSMPAPMAADMGMAAGGLMRQEIRPDPYGIDAWDTDQPSRVYVHLCDAAVWRHVTGQQPPTVPPTAAEYEANGIPWFEGYADGSGLDGGSDLAGIKSVAEIGKDNDDVPYADNATVTPGNVKKVNPAAVTDGTW
ncbi:putative integral membrane protein (plasmid) [Euzebya pacifica]|uniref:Putative integral membrane protein n=1 Tax=Euzebya pacifica TaxID=1608957 RepID=A0A346Y6J3_9ACTN|nr:hypothetical protein [Euzebya pacifica]AXV10090.1 putative integral membrane protein [Euzebya pacifica]